MTTCKAVYMEARPEFMTAADIQRELQVSRATAYNLLLRMEEKGLTNRIGKSHRVTRDNLDQYLRRSKPVLKVLVNEKGGRKK